MSKLACPVWRVTKTQFTLQTSPETIDALLKRIRAYKNSFFWIVDSASSRDFLDLIQKYGWKGGGVTIWALDVHTLPEHYTYPEGVTVERVTTSEGLRDWAHACVAGYPGMPTSLYDRTVELLDQHGFVASPGVHYYLGRLNGEPVTSNLLFLGGGVAGIYCTATIPHARRHGVASAAVMQSLLDTRSMGYHIATL